ncbi:MAG: DUF2807 domain-containing protein [Bacteroidales bacterium]|nr:DUF2807 domain-containing protein [Bacteroidales bacterium]
MNRFFRLPITLLLLILPLTSCEYIHNLTDKGKTVQRSQTTGSVNSIIIDAPVRIVLHNNESDEITIEGTKRLVDNLELITDNQSLFIKHSKKDFIQKSKLIELGISAKHLQKITANTAFELIAPDTIQTNNFAMTINGGAKFAEIELNVVCQQVTLNVYGNNNIGNFYIGGKASSARFTLEGSVNINALGLHCTSSSVIHKSIGSCKVQPLTSLIVKTYSSGHTYYKGNPEIKHECIEVPYLKCSGKLIKID